MSRYTHLLLPLTALALLISCEGPDIDDGYVWGCATKDDCGEGFFCASGACVTADKDGQNGVYSNKLMFGLTAPLSSSFSAAFYEGLQAAFDESNKAGGVHGRQLEIKALDDAGDPAKAAQNASEMLNSREVFAIFGAETAEAIAEAATSARRVAFGMASGSADLRKDPPDDYIFNFRPSDEAEAEQLVSYLLGREPAVSEKNIAMFAPADGAELAPRYASIKAAFEGHLEGHGGSVTVFTYPAGTTQISDTVGEALKWLANGDREPDLNGQLNAGLIMAGDAEAAAAFTKETLDEVYDIVRGFSDGRKYDLSEEEAARIATLRDAVLVSTAATEIHGLSEILKGYGLVEIDSQGTERRYCEGIVTTQPVPHWSGGSAGVLGYRDALEAWQTGAKHSFASFEGYAVGRMVVEALEAQGKDLVVDAFRDTLEGLDSIDVGIGAPVSFSASVRQGSDKLFYYKASVDCDWEQIDIAPVGTEPPIVDDPCTDGVCPLVGTITEDKTLTADKQWLLRGPVFVGSGTANATLTIEPGTTIMGDFDTKGYLAVRRGSKIIAEGTREQPIIFTSSKLPGSRGVGDWGGLVLNGYAPINVCEAASCEAYGEGGTGAYGGDDPDDNSGVLKFVRIEFAGRLISEDNELNGLSLQGVGRGTTLDYIQVHRGKDDGIEFYGGTVDAKHLYITGAQDDSIDWTEGWSGRIQFAIVRQWTGGGDRAIEADSSKRADAAPRSSPVLSNVTLIGHIDGDRPEDEPQTNGTGILLRVGTQAALSSFVVTNFASGCLDIDDETTFTQLDNGDITFTHSVLSCDPLTKVDDDDAVDVEAWLTAQEGIDVTDPMLDGVELESGSPAESGGATPSDGFFESVDYRGAMGASSWLTGWTTNEES